MLNQAPGGCTVRQDTKPHDLHLLPSQINSKGSVVLSTRCRGLWRECVWDKFVKIWTCDVFNSYLNPHPGNKERGPEADVSEHNKWYMKGRSAPLPKDLDHSLTTGVG